MDGYAKMGRLMGEYPEVAIFRRFGALNMENLLLLQAELQDLEIRLRELQKADLESGHVDRTNYSRDWYTLKESGDSVAEPGNDGQQWALMLEIRDKLKEYNAALVQHAQVIQLGSPAQGDLGFLQEWMSRTSMGNISLVGNDSKIWAQPDLLDLVSLKRRSAEDIFTSWVHDTALLWYHRSIGRFWRKSEVGVPHRKNTVSYSETGIGRFTKLVTTTLACLMPVASIAVLYAVTSMPKRLGIVSAMTAAFSASMGVVTDAGLGDIFAATAAFAAVQVVFIGTNGPNAKSDPPSSSSA